jgi:hypothetical protein
MPADNGIYILYTKDGYRVAHCQAIENIYWWRIYHCDCERNTEESWNKCDKCGAEIINEERDEPSPIQLKNYFGESELYLDKKQAMGRAVELYHEIISDPICPICEYGIQIIYLPEIIFPN